MEVVSGTVLDELKERMTLKVERAESLEAKNNSVDVGMTRDTGWTHLGDAAMLSQPLIYAR